MYFNTRVNSKTKQLTHVTYSSCKLFENPCVQSKDVESKYDGHQPKAENKYADYPTIAESKYADYPTMAESKYANYPTMAESKYVD